MSARIPFAALQANTLVQGRQRKTNQGGGKHPSHPTELTATKENGSLHPQRDRQIPPASANCNGSKNSWSVKPTPSSIAQDNTTTHWSSAEVERTARRSFRDVVAASRKSSRSSIHLGGRNTSWEVLSRPESSHQSFIISRQTQAPLRNDDEVASCGIGSTGGAASPEQSQQAPFVGSTAAPSTDVGQARPEVDDELDCAQDTPLQHGFDASQDLLSPRPAEQDNRLSEKEILLGIYPSPDSLPRSEAAPCNDTGSSGIASDGSCEQRSAVPLVPLTQTSSGPASLSRLSPDSPCGLHRLTGSSLDYTSTHEVKEGQDSLEGCTEPSRSGSLGEEHCVQAVDQCRDDADKESPSASSSSLLEDNKDVSGETEDSVDSGAREHSPAPSFYFETSQGELERSPAADASQCIGAADAPELLLEPPLAYLCEPESPFPARLHVNFDFDGEKEGAQRDLRSILGDDSPDSTTSPEEDIPIQQGPAADSQGQTTPRAADTPEERRRRQAEVLEQYFREQEERRRRQAALGIEDSPESPSSSEEDTPIQQRPASDSEGQTKPRAADTLEDKRRKEALIAALLGIEDSPDSATEPPEDSNTPERSPAPSHSAAPQGWMKRSLWLEAAEALEPVLEPFAQLSAAPYLPTQLQVCFDFDGEKEGAQRDLKSIMGDGSLAAWLARGPEDLRKGVTWTVGSELETIWQAANDREAMRARLEEAEAALAMLRQRQEEEELREVDDGASSSIDDDWPSWSDSDEEEEEDEAPGGRWGGSPGGKREDEAPRAAPVKSLQEQKQEEFHRKCDDMSFRLKRIHQEGERVLAATDKPLRKRWSQRPGKEPVVVVSASEAPSSGSSSSGPGETSSRGAGAQLPGPCASDPQAEPDGSPAASRPPSPSALSGFDEVMASGGGATNPLFEDEDGDDAGDDELPFLPSDHPEPNRCPESNACPTPLLWLSQAGCHRGTRSGMGGGHPSPGVDQDREQGAYDDDEQPCHRRRAAIARRRREWDPEFLRRARILGIQVPPFSSP